MTAGPGLTNTVTAVKNAQMAQSPVIIIGGATSDLLKGKKDCWCWNFVLRFGYLKIHQSIKFEINLKWMISTNSK